MFRTADRGPRVTIDDEFVALATQVPGFGGMFVDSTGALNVFLTDTSFATTALAETAVGVLRSFAGSRMHQLVGVGAAPYSERIVFRHARYDFSQLAKWHASVARGDVVQEHVTMLDIDDAANRLTIGVRDDADRERTAANLVKLGLPEDAFAVVQQDFIETAGLQDYHRPVVGGLQIAFDGKAACTLGFLTWQNSARHFVTAAHCTSTPGDGAYPGSSPGHAVGQPNASAGHLGYEVYDPPFFFTASDPLCPTNKRCRYSDAVIASIEGTTNWHYSVIAQSGATAVGNNPTIYGALYINHPSIGPDGYLGWYKVGRTTGTTGGSKLQGCVSYGQSEGGQPTDRWFICQHRNSHTVAGGDSGGPVYLACWSGASCPAPTPRAFLAGIVWGVNGVYSSITDVNYELGGGLTYWYY